MDTIKKVRLAFIGCGSHSTTNLYPCLPYIAEIDFIATCDLKADLATRNARNFGAARWYTDFQKMLDKEQLDAVIICGTPQMHTKLGIACLEAGLHVLVEKPSAISASEAKRFAQAAKSNNRYGMVAFMKRFATGYKLAKHITSKPEFGSPTAIYTKFANGPYSAIWGLESALTSFLIGQAVHMFDLIRHFMGDVKEIYANYFEIAENKFGYAVNLKFQSGAIGVMNLNSFQSWNKFDEWLEISGDEHFLVVDNMLELRYYPKGDWAKSEDLQIYNLSQNWTPTGPIQPLNNQSKYLIGFHGEITHFVKSILQGVAPAPNLEDGYKALQIAEAVYESHQTGKIVEIE